MLPPSEPNALAERNPVGDAHLGPPFVEPDMPLAGRAQALEHDGPSPALHIMDIHARAFLEWRGIFTPRHAFHEKEIQGTFEFWEQSCRIVSAQVHPSQVGRVRYLSNG